MVRCRNNSWFVRWREDGKQVQRHFGSGPGAKRKAELFDLEIKKAKKEGRASPTLEEAAKPTKLHIDDICSITLITFEPAAGQRSIFTK